MSIEILLSLWTGIAVFWSILSWWLVITSEKPTAPIAETGPKKSLTIFKPLSPLEDGDLQIVSRGLESFIAQTDEASELLLGVHEANWAEVKPFVERMQASYPKARIVVIQRSDIDTLPNPKIAWQKILAPHATGELWLWSDADIIAPRDFLKRARAEFETCGSEMLTFPYAVREVARLPDLLDALFVNLEFYPGVLLLRKLGPVDFGLGAGMLFAKESFLGKVTWENLGASLADDFVLGQALKPIHLSATTLETVAHAANWAAAFEHYLRWKKTVCWCRPSGFAAQVIAMPVLGWLGYVLWNPFHLSGWIGLIATMQMDVLFAVLICRALGCRLNFSSWLAMETWSLWRVLFWILCWLPGPVKWRKKSWKRVREVSYAR